jgi:hypothetical protein
MGIFNKQLSNLLIVGLLLVIAVSLVNSMSLVEGHSKHNKHSSKAIGSWKRNNTKKMKSMINDISSSSEAATTIPKLQTMFDLDDAATKALKLAGGSGGFFGSDNDSDDDNNDDNSDNDDSWL